MDKPCICCGPSAVDSTNLHKYKNKHGDNKYPLDKEDVRFLCNCCGSEQSFQCALNFIDRAVAKNSVPQRVLMEEPYYNSIIPYYKGKRPTSLEIVIKICIKCSISSRIPDGTKPSNPYTPKRKETATAYATSAEDVSNLNTNIIDDNTLIYNDKDFNVTLVGKKKNAIKQQQAIHKALPQDKSKDVMGHLSKYNTISELKPMDVKKEVRRQKKKKQFSVDKKIQELKNNATNKKRKLQLEMNDIKAGCQLTGAFYIPSFKIIITSQTINTSLYMDLHGLAESKEDGTPSVPHMVLSDKDAKALQQHYNDNNIPIPYLDNDDFQIQLLDGIESPEDSSSTRSWSIATTVLKQSDKISDANSGRTQVPLQELMTARILSFNKSIQADQVVIAGDFSLEDGEYNCTKLLINRVQSLLTKSMDDEAVEEMYHHLYYVAGRDGKEINRTSGTNGFTSPSTHLDLLSSLHNNPSLLPNKVGACWIIQHKKFYYILYSKHNPTSNEHPIACTTYAPPMPGGSLLLNGNALEKWPVLGEMAYGKMMATLTLKRLNEVRLSNKDLPIATGPIKYELRNIEYARQAYELTNKSYMAFCKAFISVNSMSLIAWQVGEHNDHFNKKGESLENKVTFVVPSITDSIGRGGSLIENQFVFALLDWQYAARTARQYYVTHSVDMGLGPPRATGAQRHLDQYFTTADGADWVNHYNTYLAGAGLPPWQDGQQGAA